MQGKVRRLARLVRHWRGRAAKLARPVVSRCVLLCLCSFSFCSWGLVVSLLPHVPDDECYRRGSESLVVARDEEKGGATSVRPLVHFPLHASPFRCAVLEGSSTAWGAGGGSCSRWGDPRRERLARARDRPPTRPCLTCPILASSSSVSFAVELGLPLATSSVINAGFIGAGRPRQLPARGPDLLNLREGVPLLAQDMHLPQKPPPATILAVLPRGFQGEEQAGVETMKVQEWRKLQTVRVMTATASATRN